MKTEKYILEGILDAVAGNGEYSTDSSIIVNGLYLNSEKIKTDESLEQWAKDNNLKLVSTFVGNGRMMQRRYVFSRQ